MVHTSNVANATKYLSLDDELEIDAYIINKAKNNDGQALLNIGYVYRNTKQDYSKTMGWYQLAISQNNTIAYNGIEFMYFNGLGVSQDYITAMEYYLKAASGNNNITMSNIGSFFLNGRGIPADKYKAFEWFTRNEKKPENAKELNKQGIHLTEEDKNKTIYQLINEAHDIIRQVRMKRESELKEENDELKKTKSSNEQEIKRLKTRESKSSEENEELKKVKSSNEQEIKRLQNEVRKQVALLEQEKQKSGSSTQPTINLEQRLSDKMEIMNSLKRENDVYQTLVQSKNNEINLLNEKCKYIEKEVLELKRKPEEYRQCSHPLTDNSNSANNHNSNQTTNNTIEFDNQVSRSDTPNRDVDTIRVKTETESENDSSPSCQIESKKRKVSSNDL